MTLHEFQTNLNQVTEVQFQLSNGLQLPKHVHITELGWLSKNYIDCGAKSRTENRITFQLWYANDVDHQLTPQKIQSIIAASMPLLPSTDLELEVEYQLESTIGKFGLEFTAGVFVLTPTFTTCLAQDHCGISPEQLPAQIQQGTWKAKTSCDPNSNCC